MSKIKNACMVSLILLSVYQNVKATTFDELAAKNAEYLSLRADLAIAKTKADIEEQRTKAQAASKGLMGMGMVGDAVPAIRPGAGPGPAPTVKPSESSPDKEIFLNAMHGSASNMISDWQRGSQVLGRRAGEVTFDGWEVVSVAYPEAMVKKAATGKKDKAACKRVMIGSSIAASRNC